MLTVPVVSAYGSLEKKKSDIEWSVNCVIFKNMNSQHNSDSGAAPVSADNISDLSVFDESAFLNRIMGNRGLAKKVVEAFLGDIPLQIDILEQALADTDIELVTRQAHSIKGAAASINAGQIRDLAAAMEITGRSGDISAVAGDMPLLRQMFDDLKKRLELL
jgi:HPt (histidine-containing phosphotransfer) domain-containing protein